MNMNKIIDVNLQNPYKITISNSCTSIGEALKQYIPQNAVIIHDCNLPKTFVLHVVESFVKNEIPHNVIELETAGESVKTLQQFELIAEKLMAIGVNRKTTIVALGGGTVGDFVGFVASTFMRGVPFIQVPTTLLSMVDSSVGGKVAVNLGNYKNCIGAFYQPKHVFIDISFLKTLAEVELVSGYAEVLKYGFIQDRTFYDYLISNVQTFVDFIRNRNFTDEAMEYLTHIVGISCKIKAEIVSQDETETLGIRDILNFGHTFGHAFEGLYLGKLPHGIAVGIGMVCALKYSQIPVDTILKHYEAIGLLGDISQFCEAGGLQKPSVESIVNLMLKDKKNDRSGVKLILLESIGMAFVREARAEEISAFLE